MLTEGGERDGVGRDGGTEAREAGSGEMAARRVEGDGGGERGQGLRQGRG